MQCHSAIERNRVLICVTTWMNLDDVMISKRYQLQRMAYYMISFIKMIQDFPGGAVVKNPPANAGDTGSSPGPGRSHMLRSN